MTTLKTDNAEIMVARYAAPVREVTLDELEALPNPVKRTPTHYPIRHDEFRLRALEALQAQGLDIVKQRLLVSKDEQKFMMIADLALKLKFQDGQNGVHAAFGLINAHDMSVAAKAYVGERVHACTNLAWWSEHEISRKHTRFIEATLPRALGNLIERVPKLIEYRQQEVDLWRSRLLDDKDFSHYMIGNFERGILNTRSLPLALENWRRPAKMIADGRIVGEVDRPGYYINDAAVEEIYDNRAHHDKVQAGDLQDLRPTDADLAFTPRTLWSAFNAVTSAWTTMDKQRPVQPTYRARTNQDLNRFTAGYCRAS